MVFFSCLNQLVPIKIAFTKLLCIDFFNGSGFDNNLLILICTLGMFFGMSEFFLTFNVKIYFLAFPVGLTLVFVLSTLQACSMVTMLIIKLAPHQLPCHQLPMMRKRRMRMRKQVCFSFTQFPSSPV